MRGILMPRGLGEAGLSALPMSAFVGVVVALRAGRHMLSRHIVAAVLCRQHGLAYGALSGHCNKAAIHSKGKIDGYSYVIVVEAQIPLCRV